MSLSRYCWPAAPAALAAAGCYAHPSLLNIEAVSTSEAAVSEAADREEASSQQPSDVQQEGLRSFLASLRVRTANLSTALQAEAARHHANVLDGTILALSQVQWGERRADWLPGGPQPAASARKGQRDQPMAESRSTSADVREGTPDTAFYKTAEHEAQAPHVHKTAPLANEYREDLQELRSILEARGIPLPARRFGQNNAELMRFGFTHGLCQAKTPKERRHALDTTAAQIADTVQWLEEYPFQPRETLQKWHHLLRTVDDDPDGHPVLLVRLGDAARESAEGMKQVAEAIISHVEWAVEQRLSDDPGLPEQLVVVADCSGASSFQASRMLPLIKTVAQTLNRHFPGRLHRFYLVDLPAVIRWPVKAIVAMGHPSTHEKIVLCSANDPRLPHPMEAGQ